MKNQAQKHRRQITDILAGVFILLLFLTSSCSPAAIQKEPIQTSPPLTIPSPTSLSPSSTALPPQRLRVTNQSSLAIQHLVVRFPEGQIDFGEVLPATTTAYQTVPHGVYRYAAYDVVVNGQEYQQPVRDWIGETPLDGEAFTYILDVDPAKWVTKGQVIQLIDVKEDPSR